MDSKRENCWEGRNQQQQELPLTGPAPEVVLVISGEDAPNWDPGSTDGDKQADAPRPKPSLPGLSPHSLVVGTSSPGHNKPPLQPPRHDAALRQRRSLSRSSLSKPKSRFVEQPPRSAGGPAEDASRHLHSPRVSGGGGTPRENLRAGGGTPRADGDEEEEEEDIYSKERPGKDSKQRRWRRCRVWVLLEWLVLVAAAACLAASLAVPGLRGVAVWGLEIWKWCVMAIAVGCGRLLTGWLVLLLVFLIERNFLLKKKVLYFVYGLRNGVRVCIWLGLVLLAWTLLFHRGVRLRRGAGAAEALDLVTRALVSLLVASVVWLVKTLLVKLLAASFHVNTFFDRIQESIFQQYVLQALSGPPAMELEEGLAGGSANGSGRLSFWDVGEGKGKRKGGERKGVIDVGKLHRVRPDKVSAWTMKGLINAISGSGFLTISDVIDDSADDDEEGGETREREIIGEWEAKAAARQIFKNVAKPGSKYIEEEDLLRFLSKEEADTVLPQFEGVSETGKIKKSAFKNWVVKAYLNRKSLAYSLNDTKTAVNQLHKLISAIVVIVIVMISLLLMGFATTKVFVFLSSQLLLVAFMFGNACKTVFEAIIFVFVMHPFDVGDRCVIDGVQMIVEEMNILTTVFLRYDNEKIYYPNVVLATKPISNFYRSPDMGDSIEFSIDFSTSLERIGALKARIKLYIESKPQHWHPNHTVVVKDIINVNKMNMALYVLHTMNHQNMSEKSNRRSELVIELKKIFEELSIRYNLPPQEVHLSCVELPPMPSLTLGR